MKRFLPTLLFLLAGAANAAYPDKPITMVVAYSPGGVTDLIARAIAPYLEKYLGGGARIVIVHRPGAGGEIGFAAIANAVKFFAPLRFLSPAEFERVNKEAEAGFRQLWKELPWGDK